MLRSLILCILAAGSFGSVLKLQPPVLDPRIVGGTEVNIRQHPYQLSLQTTRHTCGASIIARNWVITAAHCVRYSPQNYTVLAGSNDKYLGCRYGVKSIHKHPQNNPSIYDYDATLLEIDGEIKFNEDVLPLELGFSELPNGTVVDVTGWGTTTEGGSGPDRLMKVSVPIVDRKQCRQLYRDIQNITESMICAGVVGKGGKDSCQGDSGGPLIVNGTLYGIVSWGYGCARPNHPGVYANVAVLKKWICEITKLAKFCN